MKKSPFSIEHEKIVADALRPVATELRLIDAADLVSSAAELYFHPGTVNFGSGGDYRLEWGGSPEVTLDLEIKPKGVSVYARLTLADRQAAIEIDHIAFQNPSDDPDENTRFLARSLTASKFAVDRQAEAA